MIFVSQLLILALWLFRTTKLIFEDPVLIFTKICTDENINLLCYSLSSAMICHRCMHCRLHYCLGGSINISNISPAALSFITYPMPLRSLPSVSLIWRLPNECAYIRIRFYCLHGFKRRLFFSQTWKLVIDDHDLVNAGNTLRTSTHNYKNTNACTHALT